MKFGLQTAYKLKITGVISLTDLAAFPYYTMY